MQKSRDGTLKFRFVLHDGLRLNLLIPVLEKIYTVCIFFAGRCSLSCSFCATGRMGLLRPVDCCRNFDQYAKSTRNAWRSMKSRSPSGAGMGEPLLNYKM
ncbi:MAG: hypothetical protein IPF46_16110 [Saprospiraceae bacterium]|nr:hypothetical protein [Candidatus Vicinibacter affinis]